MSLIRSVALHFEKQIDNEILVETFASILEIPSIQFRFVGDIHCKLKHEALVSIELVYSSQGYRTYTCLFFDRSLLKGSDDIVFGLTVSRRLDTKVFVELDERFGIICAPDGITTRSEFDYEIGVDDEEFLVLY